MRFCTRDGLKFHSAGAFRSFFIRNYCVFFFFKIRFVRRVFLIIPLKVVCVETNYKFIFKYYYCILRITIIIITQ